MPNSLAIANPDVLKPWEHRIWSGYSNSRCDGRVLTVEEETEQRRISDELIAKAEQERKADEERHLREAPEILKGMSTNDFCVAYGRALMEQLINELVLTKGVAGMAKAEAKRRKLSFNTKIIDGMRVKLGMSECELYASWGLPERQNRSVSSFSVRIQHIYGRTGPFIYTENGRVVSWQD